MDHGTASSPLADAGQAFADDALAAHPDFARLSQALASPETALRARFNAVIADLVLLGFAWGMLLGLLGGGHRPSPADAAGWFLVAEFLYFFGFELARGQTIGKRAFRVRVASADGAVLSTKQIALRNAIRPLDALPFLYASGLISMIRTGPARRQRMGDVAAGTTVVLSDGGKPLRTPRWLLPTATIVAALLSIGIIVRLAGASSARTPRVASLAGEAPAPGKWSAQTQVVQQSGWMSPRAGAATLQIERDCTGSFGACGYALTLETAGEPAQRGRLLEERGVWVVVFPARTVACARGGGLVRGAMALRFGDGGRVAEGEERYLSSSPVCGATDDLLGIRARVAG
jgi:uncharacterized RDD family membrane protein YckC